MSTAPPILASTSPVRRAHLAAAGVAVEAVAPRVDEETLLAALAAEGATPRDIADTLAEQKAVRVAARVPDRF
ncbi:MAG: Maf family protein, partial [Gemmobacter sp.]